MTLSVSRSLFLAVLAAVVVARLLELRIANRNARRLLAAGAREEGAGHYPWMVALHTAFLVASPAEVWLLERPFIPPLAAAAAALLLAATLLRVWAIRSLGSRWTTRILVPPGGKLVRRGPYRFVRHPNYLAVAVEIAALPLIHTAWLTALVFSPLNALLLRVRIRAEEAALGIR